MHQLKRLMSNLTEFHTDCHKVGMTSIRVEIYMIATIVNDSTSLFPVVPRCEAVPD